MKSQLKGNALIVKNFINENNDLEQVKNLYKLSVLNRITIIKIDGSVLYDSASDTKESHKDRKEVIDAIEKTEGFEVRYSHTLKEKMIYYSIMHNNIVIRVAQDYSEIDKKLMNDIISNIFYYILLNFFLFLMYRIILKKYYFEKLTHMQKIIESGKEAKELYLEKDKDLIGFWHVIKDWQNKNLENIDILKEEKEKLRTIIETIDLGILVISSNDKIMSYNSEAKYLFFNNSEGTRYFEKLKCTEIISFIQKSMKLTEDITEEIHLRESGKYFIAKSKYLSDHSKFIFTFRDVTHIREKSKLEKKFITNISHELKTPLTNIKGYMYVIEGEEDKEMQKSFIDTVNRNIERLEAIIGDFLNFQRIEANKIVTNSPVNISDIVFKIVEEMDKLIEKKKAKIIPTYIVKDSNYYINIDSEKIKTLLKNLIENAIIYNDKESPEIYVVVEEGLNFIKYKVKDNGIGMPEKELNKIFDSFYRIDKARTSNIAGTGIGLSIVKEIVEIHKGDIKVESKEGIGTEFIIKIPK